MSEKKILLAVSGGIDSMCMLSMAPELFRESTFSVAHCNFSLRAEESDADEALVRSWCEEHGITCHVKVFDTASYASENGISIEMAARDLRYAWFAELCRENGYDAVAVAHNANDNAETMVLNLLRSTGGRGLRGMKEEGHVPGAPDVRLLRPLLKTSREEIEVHVRKNGIPFRLDRTNLETIYKRNRIRNEVFPIFAEINPSFLPAMERAMAHIAQENDIAEEYFNSVREGVMDGSDILTGPLMECRHWEYVLFRILEPYGYSEETLEALTDLLKSGRTFSGKTFQAPGYRLITSSGRLVITSSEDNSRGPLKTIIDGPGEYQVGGRTVSISIAERSADLVLRQPEGILIADAEKARFPLVLRGWQNGDWMRPLGMRGRKKLSDLFVDLGWSVLEKERAIILAEDGSSRVLALIGARIDDSVKISPESSSVMTIRII